MEAAKKISFKIQKDGNGYGHFYAEFGEGEQRRITEIGMVCGCENKDMAATVISILESYKQLEVDGDRIDLIVAESSMRCAESRFNELKKKEKENAVSR